jgi:hypothetical protein
VISIETVPFEKTKDGYARMLAKEARFRLVIEVAPSA